MAPMSVRIRQARTGARLSQARLASEVGVRRSAVAQWEAPGGTSPSVAHLSQLASITTVCFEWLATGRGPMRVSATEAAETAALIGDFARDEIENQALDLLRRLPHRNRLVACRLLAALAT